MDKGPEVQGSGASIPEPSPVYGGREVFPELIRDIESRAELGIRKYGGRLTANNGRHTLIDAYQESLDLAVYLKQALIEAEPTDTATIYNLHGSTPAMYWKCMYQRSITTNVRLLEEERMEHRRAINASTWKGILVGALLGTYLTCIVLALI